MNHQCFQVLHPWAYELDNVDFKYIVNNNLVEDICKHLTNFDAQVFWLSFFKPQKACSADEFFEAVRQVCEINKIRPYWDQKLPIFTQMMQDFDQIISIESHADIITSIVSDLVSETVNQVGYCSLQHQLKLYQT